MKDSNVRRRGQSVQQISTVVHHDLFHVFLVSATQAAERPGQRLGRTASMANIGTASGKPAIFLLVGEFVDLILGAATEEDSPRFRGAGDDADIETLNRSRHACLEE